MSKVALLGASGGIGQPLALLLKMSKLIKELALYDIKQAATPAAGVAADVSHVNTASHVKGYAGDDELSAALTGSSVVVITAGVPRKPGMTRDDLFNINAKIVKGLVEAVAKYCPTAVTLIVTNPVNSTVPIAVEVMKKAGCFQWNKVLGVTTLDAVRASTFIGEILKKDPKECSVPIIGGHAGETIMPVLSQAVPSLSALSEADIIALDKHIQDAGTDVVNAKGGAGSATLSMAFAGCRFAESVLSGLAGNTVTECCYFCLPKECPCVKDVAKDLPDFFALPVELGKEGIAKVLPVNTLLGKLSAYESKRFAEAKCKVDGDVKKGQEFGRQ